MRNFKFRKSTYVKGSVALLAGAVMVVSGCQAKEVLDFYKAMTAASTFTNYQYMITMESPQFAEAATKTSVLQNAFDGIALKGIITDDTAFSTAIQLKIDGQYQDLTQVVIRDNRIYLDLGSILTVMNKLAPDTYAGVQTSIDQIKQGIDQSPDEFNKQLEPYGLTADDIKDRLDKNIGWVYISFSTVDEALSTVKDANDTFKDAVSIDKVESLDEDKYPEAARLLVKQISEAFEKRFGEIEPSFASINKAGNEFSFHLNNDNLEAFLDGCANFASDDLLPILDNSIEAMNKQNMSDAAKSVQDLKDKLLEKHETYSDDWTTKVEKTAIESAVDSIKKTKDSFVESKDKADFDWLSTVSLTGNDGSRVWKSSHTVSVEVKDSASSSGEIKADMMSTIDMYDTPAMQDVEMTVSITLQEFKDSSAAVSAMVNPEVDAFCLDAAALNALESAKSANTLSSSNYKFD